MKTYLRTWLTIPMLCLMCFELCFAQDGAKTQRDTTPAIALQNQLRIGFDPKFELRTGNPATWEKIQAFALRRNPKKYFDDSFIFFAERDLMHRNSEGSAAPVYNPYAGPRRNASPGWGPVHGKLDIPRELENRPLFDYNQASRLESEKLSKGRQTLNFLLGTAASVYVSSKQNGR